MSRFDDIEFNPGVNINTDKLEEEDKRNVEIIEEDKNQHLELTREDIQLLMKNELDYEREKVEEINKQVDIIQKFSISILSFVMISSSLILAMYFKELGLHYLFLSILYFLSSAVVFFLFKTDFTKRKIIYYIVLFLGCCLFLFFFISFVYHTHDILNSK